MKILLLMFCLGYLLIMANPCFADELLEAQLNHGIRNSDTVAYMLIKQAENNGRDAEKLLNRAMLYSPDLPAIYFAMAKEKFSLSYSGILEAIDFVVKGINAYGRNFWWTFTLMGSIFIGISTSFILSITFIICIRLISDISLIAHDILESSKNLYLVGALLPLSAVSPLLFLAGVLILIGIYIRRIDRILVYAFLLFVVFSPAIIKGIAIFNRTMLSGVIRAVVEINESRDNSYALNVLNGKNDYEALFSYALALKREGRFDEAIDIYNRLLKIKNDPWVYINLGNCFVGLNNNEEAAKQYKTAVSITPLASGYYNLSQVSREMLDFDKGDEYFKKALAIDRIAVSEYRSVYGRNANRLVADAVLPASDLWEFVISTTQLTPYTGLKYVQQWAVPVFACALIFVYYFLSKRIRHRAFRCKRCSTVLCPRCEKQLTWGQMCPQCFKSLIKLDELEARERVARLLAIYEHQKRRRNIMKILSLVLPGSAHVYGGRILVGMLFMWPFLFFILVPVIIVMFIQNGNLLSHEFFKWASLSIAFAIYILANIITRQRILRGWL